MKSLTKIWMLAAVACLAFAGGTVACGDDDDDNGGSGGSGGGAGGSGGSGGDVGLTFSGKIAAHPLQTVTGVAAPSVAGLTVKLYSAVAVIAQGNAAPALAGPVTTTADGSYSFTDVPNTFVSGGVVGITGTGFVQTYQGICSTDPTSSVKCSDGETGSVAFAVSEAVSDALDAALDPPGEMSAFETGYILGQVLESNRMTPIGDATIGWDGIAEGQVAYPAPNGTGGFTAAGTATSALTGAYAAFPATAPVTVTATKAEAVVAASAGGKTKNAIFGQFLVKAP